MTTRIEDEKACENSTSKPCPNKPYRYVTLSWLGSQVARYALCRKHYEAVMGSSRLIATTA